MDGKTHINVYSKGKTLIGRLLSNFALTPFVHPEDGEFNSVEGYWYWLGCKDERLRAVHGFEAKKIGREAGAPDWLDGEVFQNKIKKAITAKVLQNPDIANKLVDTSLPFRHYYIYGDAIVEVPEGQWIIDFLEDLRMILIQV